MYTKNLEQTNKKLFVATNDVSKEETKEQKEIRHIEGNMRDINPTISIILLNVNELSTPIKRQTLLISGEKENPTTCCLQEDTLQTQRRKQDEGKQWAMVCCADSYQGERGARDQNRPEERPVSLEVKRAGYGG